MKLSYQAFTSLLCAGAAAATAASPPTLILTLKPSPVQRDLATVTSVFATVGSSLSSLDAAVKKFNSLADAATLETAATDLLTALKSGASAVQASSDLSLTDAVQLQQVVGGLQTTGQSLSGDLMAKKTVVESLGLCTIVQQQTADIAAATKSLSDAVVSKVPQAAQAIASQLAGGFTNAVANAQAAFATGNCTNSATGSTTSSGGSGSGASGSNTTTGMAPSQSTGSSGSGPVVVNGAGRTVAAGGVGLLGLAFALALM